MNKWAEKAVHYRSEIAAMHAEGISDADMIERVSRLIYRPTVVQLCELCGTRFERPVWQGKKQRFCSHKCGGLARRYERITKECEQCGDTFGADMVPSLVKQARFCSRLCAGTVRTAVNSEKYANIVARREQGNTYQSIGDHFGISRERVRQILHLAGRQDLCFWAHGPCVTRIEKVCINSACKKSFKVLPGRDKVFCSRSCFFVDRREREWKRQRLQIKRVIKLRHNGATWKKAGLAIGFNCTQPSTQALMLIKRWRSRLPDLEQRLGLDV